MTTARRFLFDRDFDAPRKAEIKAAQAQAEAEAEAEAEAPPTFSEEELEQARADAHAEGVAQGRRAEAAEIAARVARTLDGIANRFAEVFAAEREGLEAVRRDAVAVAATIVSKLFPSLNDRHGLDEVRHLVEQTLAHLIEEPRVVVRINGAVREPVEAHLQAVARRVGFEGRIVVLEEPSMADGDCAIEWQNGGAERDAADMWRAVNDIVERHLREEPGVASRLPDPLGTHGVGGRNGTE